MVQNISGYINQPIIPGKTLLFFDEIQECEEAITALRYFKEELQELHVIAAGSLVDFKLKKVGLPVGRLQFLYLHPLSFAEYCEVAGYQLLYQQAPHSLYNWHRENKQSNAEVDFLFVKNNEIIPVEVKSGRFGHLKSLNLFLESHPHSSYGLKISESNEENVNLLESIPFYAI